MAVNSIGDFIRSVFPTLVNKNGKIFKALLADGDGGGTVESIFSDLEETRKAWTGNKRIYDQKGEQLQKTLDVFSVVSKLQDETEATFLKRNELLFYRNGDKVWGGKWNILNIFKTFFNNENVYLVNNTERFDGNLLADGNFEHKDVWELEDCSYEHEAHFEGISGVLFNAAGTCRQSVNVKSDTSYFLHFFVKGNIRVQIKDNNNRYWNPRGGEFGAWNDAEYSMEFESPDWDNKSFYFITDANVASVQVTFLYEPGHYAFLDYVRLNEKTGASTFSLIAVFEGAYSEETVSLAPGTNDDIPGVDYMKMAYFDSAYIFGSTNKDAQKIYQELLDVVQPAGVVSTIEILVKE